MNNKFQIKDENKKLDNDFILQKSTFIAAEHDFYDPRQTLTA